MSVTAAFRPLEHPSRAGSLHLIGNHPVLNFTNTSSGRNGPEWLDHLQQPDHLCDWAVHAGVVSPQRAAGVRIDDGALLRALALREAIYRALDRVRQNEDPDPADVGVIVAEHGRCLSAAVLTARTKIRTGTSAGDADRGGLSWGWNEDDERVILGPLVTAALSLLTGEAAGRVRCCPGHQCGWLFLDITRNGRRRWCDMAVCGNRAKAGRHRAARRNEQKGTERK